jgi:hypothetical protein
LKQDLLLLVSSNEMRCTRCHKIIPFTFKKGAQYTCSSFTMTGADSPVCYRCYHPADYKKTQEKGD